MSAFQLGNKQFSIVTVAAKDASQNAAPFTITSFEINDHAKAYAVQRDATSIIVVSRGPAGAFALTVNATSAGGAALVQSQDFSVAVGDATALTLTPGTATDPNITTPPVPQGW